MNDEAHIPHLIEDRKVIVGEAVQAMILNALGFVSHSLYLTPEFFENKPIEILIGADLEAKDFKDDSLGRALDALYEAGVTEVYAKIASHALKVYGIEHQAYHLDSTSVSFHGQYSQDKDPRTIKITHKRRDS